MRFYVFALIIIYELFSFTVFSQKRASISGIVIDAKTGESLPGTNVFLEGTSIGCSSDGKGKFSILNIPPGKYTLVASFIGYETVKEPLEIKGGENIEKTIKMTYSGDIKLPDVVITVQAKGQVKAINQQLSASSMKNVISSERIQELPDANAAESLGRLPGVAVLRSGGEGARVIIRGMAPKYNKVMIDGVEIASTGSFDRSTNLSMISPYSLEGIEVYKSPTAEYDADFIGGIVNFKLRTAPKGFHTDFLAEGTYNDLKKTYNDYNFVGSLSNRFFKNKLGVFIQGNAERRNRSANTLSWSVWDRGAYDPDKTPNNKLYRNNKSLSDVVRVRKRVGATLVLDYNLRNGEIAFKNFYNQGYVNVQTQQEVFGIATHRNMDLRTTDAKYKTSILSNVLSYQQQLSNFMVDIRLSRSSSVSKTPRQIQLYTNNFSLKPGFPDSLVQSYYDYPEGLSIVRTLTDENSKTEQIQYGADANVAMNFTISSNVSGKLKIGAKYRIRDKFYDPEVWKGYLGDNAGPRVAIYKKFPQLLDEGGSPTDLIKYPKVVDNNYKPGEFLKGQYVLGPRVDIDLLNQIGDFMKYEYYPTLTTTAEKLYYSRDERSSEINDYSGNEYLWATYLLAEFNITSKLTLIPGVRYEHNKTIYEGKFGDTRTYLIGAPYFTSDTMHTRVNGFWLPNLQIKYEPVKWLQIRFGYTNTLARPSYGLLVPKMELRHNYEIVKNNFNLRPEQARNFDFMVSAKENHLGLFTVVFFTKAITDKIYWGDKRYIHDPAQFELDSTYLGQFIYTQYNNPYISKVRGVELDWQTVFWYLPGILKGLVLNTNYTYTWSQSKYPTTDIHAQFDPQTYKTIFSNVDSFYVDRLIDQPEHVFNLSLGYDYKGFSARVSMNYQSNMSRGYSKHMEYRRYTGKYIRWDFSVKQSLPVKGLQIYANMNNINKSVDKDYVYGASFPVREQYYGMTVTVGLRWRL
jgi:outer membrane receptor protein involved in Fe transport